VIRSELWRRLSPARRWRKLLIDAGADSAGAGADPSRVLKLLLLHLVGWTLLTLLLVLVVAFLAAVPPMVVWSLTGQRWATLWVGLPLPPLLVFSVFVLVSCSAWWDAPWITVLCGGIFGGCAGWLVLGALMRNVAIRVGPAGVVLGTRPVRGDVRFVPWSEIDAVVVSEVRNGGRRLDRVGVYRHGETSGLPRYPAREALDGAPVPEDIVAPESSVAAGTWRLDMDRLKRAVELNAP
jgi:hypothetical protein